MKRVIIGRRSNGSPNKGIFISPPGVDAETAPDASLTLNISEKINQLVMSSFVTFSQTVPLGLARSPFVFLTSRADLSQNYGYGALTGPIRPSPYGTTTTIQAGDGSFLIVPLPPSATATINGNGASMFLSVSGRVDFAVYRNAFT